MASISIVNHTFSASADRQACNCWPIAISLAKPPSTVRVQVNPEVVNPFPNEAARKKTLDVIGFTKDSAAVP
jgi:hypothetical protein